MLTQGSRSKDRRRAAAGAAGLALLVALSACSTTAGSKSSPGQGGKKNSGFTIAYLSQGTTNAFAAQADAIVSHYVAAHKTDIKNLLYYDGAGDANKQVTQMETAVRQKPDVMVVTPLGTAAMSGPVSRAMAQGIPVVLCLSDVNGKDYTSLVDADIYAESVADAEWLVKEMGGKGNVVIIDGIAGVGTSELEGKAARTVFAKYPGIKIVGQGYGNWSPAKVKQLMETFMASGKKIDGTWGSGGQSTAGIIQAFTDAGLPVPPSAGGSPYNGAARLAMEHKVPVAMSYFPPAMFEDCITTAVKAAKGEKLPKFYNETKIQNYAVPITLKDLPKYYNPKYADDYEPGTDKILTETELRTLNLVK